MFQNLWSLFSIDLAGLASVAVVGVLTIIGWMAVAAQRQFRVAGSMIPLSVGVLYDGAVGLNQRLGERIFPEAGYNGLVPFFYKWQIFSFVWILVAGVLLFVERPNVNRAALWGVIAQLVIHCCTVLLFITWH